MEMYRILTYGGLLLALLTLAHARESPPTVNVYNERPLVKGEENTVICHLSSFHPPNIKAELLKNGAVMPDVETKDMSFDETWKYKLTMFKKITYQEGDSYSCRYTFMDNKSVVVQWDPME